MDFIGTGKRLLPSDIARAAHEIGCEEAAIKAVIAVEARGRGFDDSNRPTMLFEPHVFYDKLAGADRIEAVQMGLAYKDWKPGHYPKTADERYRQLERATDINENAALMACSWGLGQVMGKNFDKAGFWTVQDMVKAALEGEGRQLDQMIAFIISAGLTKALRSRDWASFARGYNGAGYAANAYDKKLAAAYAKAKAGNPVEADPLADGVLSIGDKGHAVMVLQTELMAEKLLTKADGDFGPMTKQAVEIYQRKLGLIADGVVGPATAARLGLDWAPHAKAASFVDAPAQTADDAPTGILGLILKLISALFRR